MSSSRKRARHPASEDEQDEDHDRDGRGADGFQDVWLEALKAEEEAVSSGYFEDGVTTPKERKTELLFHSSASASPGSDLNANSMDASEGRSGNELMIQWVGEETSLEALRISRSRSARRGAMPAAGGGSGLRANVGGGTPTSNGAPHAKAASSSIPQTPYALLEDWHPASATSVPSPSGRVEEEGSRGGGGGAAEGDSPTIIWFQFEPIYLPPLSSSLLLPRSNEMHSTEGTTRTFEKQAALGKEGPATPKHSPQSRKVAHRSSSSPSKPAKKKVDFQAPQQEVIEVFSQTQRPVPPAGVASSAGATKTTHVVSPPKESKGRMGTAAAIATQKKASHQKTKEKTPSTTSESEPDDSESDGSDTSSSSSVQVERVTRAPRPARNAVAEKPITRSEAARLRALGFRSPFKELNTALLSKQQQNSESVSTSTSMQKQETNPAPKKKPTKKPLQESKDTDHSLAHASKVIRTALSEVAKERVEKEMSDDDVSEPAAGTHEDQITSTTDAPNMVRSQVKEAATKPKKALSAANRLIPPPPRMISIAVNIVDPLQLAVTAQRDFILPYESTFAELESQLLGQFGYRWRNVQFYSLVRRVCQQGTLKPAPLSAGSDGLPATALQDFHDPELARWLNKGHGAPSARSHVNEFLPLVERIWSAEDRLNRVQAGTRPTILADSFAAEDDPRRLTRVVFAQPSLVLSGGTPIRSLLISSVTHFDRPHTKDPITTLNNVVPAATPMHPPAPLPPMELRPSAFTLDDAVPLHSAACPAHDHHGWASTELTTGATMSPPSAVSVVLYILLMTDTGVPTSTGPPLIFNVLDPTQYEAFSGGVKAADGRDEGPMERLAGAARHTLCEVLHLPQRMQRYLADLPIVTCSVERIGFSGEHFLYLGRRGSLAVSAPPKAQAGVGAEVSDGGQNQDAPETSGNVMMVRTTECVSFALILRRLDIGMEVVLMNSALAQGEQEGLPVVGTVSREHWEHGRVSVDLLIGGSTLCTGVHPLDVLPLHL